MMSNNLLIYNVICHRQQATTVRLSAGGPWAVHYVWYLLYVASLESPTTYLARLQKIRMVRTKGTYEQCEYVVRPYGTIPT